MSRNPPHPSTSESDTQMQTFDPNRHEKLKFTGRFFKWLLTAPLPDARKQDIWVDTLPPEATPPSREGELPRALEVPVRSMTREEKREVQTLSPGRVFERYRSKAPWIVVGAILFGVGTATAVGIMQRSEARVPSNSGDAAGDHEKSASGQVDTEGQREAGKLGDSKGGTRQVGLALPSAPEAFVDSRSGTSSPETPPPMNSKAERSKVAPPSDLVVSKDTPETPSSGSPGPSESTSNTKSDRPKSNPFQPRQ